MLYFIHKYLLLLKRRASSNKICTICIYFVSNSTFGFDIFIGGDFRDAPKIIRFSDILIETYILRGVTEIHIQ